MVFELAQNNLCSTFLRTGQGHVFIQVVQNDRYFELTFAVAYRTVRHLWGTGLTNYRLAALAYNRLQSQLLATVTRKSYVDINICRFTLHFDENYIIYKLLVLLMGKQIKKQTQRPKLEQVKQEEPNILKQEEEVKK